MWISQENTIPSKKLFYDKWAIFWWAYLGGPIVAIYFLSKNFKAIWEEGNVKKTYLFGILFTIILFGLVYFIPSDTFNLIPTYLIPMVYSWIAMGVYMWYQKQKIDELMNHGFTHYSFWNVVWISFLWLLLSLAIIFIPLLLSVWSTPSSGIIANTQITYSYWVTKNKIYTNEQITKEESDKMALNLKKVGLFSDEWENEVIFSNLSWKYKVHIIVDKWLIDNQKFIQTLPIVRTVLQEWFSKNITLVLVDENDTSLKVIE
jgi:hypothetical protein